MVTFNMTFNTWMWISNLSVIHQYIGICPEIAKYNEKYKSMNLLCFGVMDKDIQVTELRTNFALKTEVQTAYKEAVLNHSYGETEEGTSEDCSFKECLHKHVYDLNVDIMRSILSTVASPLNSLSRLYIELVLSIIRFLMYLLRKLGLL